MQIQRYSFVCVAIALAGSAWPGAIAHLGVDVAPAVAVLAPAAEGRRLVNLPDLEFSFGIDAECAVDDSVTSVSISIADTRKTLTAADLPESGPLSASVSLPAQQIAPVAVDGFCFDPELIDGGEQLLVQDVVSAHLSLRCSGPGGDSITYATRSLAVTLVCAIPPEDQGAESVSTER